MKRLIYGVLGGIVGYATTRLVQKYADDTEEITAEEIQAKEEAEAERTPVIWIDGFDDADAMTMGAMPSEIGTKPREDGKPAFKVGDVVVGFNPYSLDYTHFAEDFQTPLFFEVKDSKYDKQDETYRYLLHGEEDWIAEAWLMYPMHPVQLKQFEEETDMTDEQLEKLPVTEEAQEGINELVRKAMIDRALDKLNHGTEGEKEEAKAMLAKLTKRSAKKKGDK